MHSSPTIRQATYEDADALMNVRQYAIITTSAKGYTDRVCQQWIGQFDIGDMQCCLYSPYTTHTTVAEDKGRITGFVMYNTGNGTIDMLYTWPTGQGTGSILLRTAEEKLRKEGMTHVGLSAALTARTFYELHGYTLQTRSADEPQRPAEELILLPMRKNLAA